MENYPKVSIITPSLNQGNFIEATINSVINQSYQNIEYIIIDGGSKDQSVDIIRNYEDKLSYWVSEKDKGQSHAINKGFKQASGEIITWINSDDQLTPNALEYVVDLFRKNPKVSVIHGKTVLYTLTGWEQIKGSLEEGFPHRYLAGMAFPQPSSFFRKSALSGVGLLDESFHFGMDYDLFVRMALQYDFLKSDLIFSKYLLHEDSKTTNSSLKFADDWAKVFSKVARSFPFSGHLIDMLVMMDIYHHDDGKKYTVTKSYSEKFIDYAFLLFLGNQLTFRYEGYDLKGMRKIGKYLDENHPDFLRENNYLPIYRRACLPAGLIKFMRKLIR